MEAKDLRYFIAVYEAKNFSRASELLGTVQSNVSTRIRSLEELLGVQLFERRYRSIVPTEVGRRLYVRAKPVLESFDMTERMFKAPRSAMSRKQPGFTLLELLVVVVIIGLLAGNVAQQSCSQADESAIQVARAWMDAFEEAPGQYRPLGASEKGEPEWVLGGG